MIASTTRIAPASIPAVHAPRIDCVYCWYTLQPGKNWPADWSSSICAEHRAWQRGRLVAARLARVEASTKEAHI